MAVTRQASNTHAAGLALLPIAAAGTSVSLLLWAVTWLTATDFTDGSGLARAAGAIGAVMALTAAAELAAAYGLWRQATWAWPLAVATTAAAILLTFLSAGRGSGEAHTASMLLAIGTLWYLLGPDVRDAFRESGGARP